MSRITTTTLEAINTEVIETPPVISGLQMDELPLNTLQQMEDKVVICLDYEVFKRVQSLVRTEQKRRESRRAIKNGPSMHSKRKVGVASYMAMDNVFLVQYVGEPA